MNLAKICDIFFVGKFLPFRYLLSTKENLRAPLIPFSGKLIPQGDPGQNFKLFLFWYKSYLSSFQNLVILSTNIVTFDFMIIYVEDVLSNVGENALCRKNGQFWLKMSWIWEPTSPFMLKFGLEINFGVLQKRYAANFEILIFRDFSGGQSRTFCENGKNLNFDPLKNHKKSKFQKSPHNVFIPNQNLSQDQISASTDL